MFLQNAQDIRIGGRQGNAQYQYTLQAPDFDSLAEWGPKVLDRSFERCRKLRTSAPTSRIPGLSSNVVIDRDTASRLGLTAQAVDAALYDSFGQRQVSVMYKSINQYHVVLALQQQWWESPDFLKTIYVQTPKGTDVPLSTFTHFTQGITPIRLPHQGQFPATTLSFNLAENVPLSDAVNGDQPGGSGDGPACQHHGQVRRHRAGLSASNCKSAYPDRSGAARRLYRAGNVVREPDPSPDHHLDAAFGRPGSAGGDGPVQNRSGHRGHDRNHPADWHREEERDHDDRFRAGGRTERRNEFAGCDLPGLPAAVPAHHDDDNVRAAGRDADGARLGRGIGDYGSLSELQLLAASLVSQMLTLFTTPVIYLYLDRLRKRFNRRQPSYRHRPGLLVPGGIAESHD